ncbi:Flagellar biosynthetic protein FliR [Buchnera aphidicola (Takecallis arundicolens)]|uniref:flagellar biosynthetic protein FliR n=1 Tax=Buchnera aphidicola TaxID=9 RepID=UPI0034645C03
MDTHNIIVLNNLICIFIRVFSIIYMVPVIDNSVVSNKVKVFLSFLLSILVCLIRPFVKITLFSPHGLIILIEQIIIGVSIGLTIKLVFLFIILSGEIISLQIGLYNVIHVDYNLNFKSSVITTIFNIFLLLLFLFYDGHLYVIIFIFKSFDLFPLYNTNFDISFILIFIKMLYASFLNGLIFILPIIILLFSIKIIISMMFRLSTQILTVFIDVSLLYFVTICFLFFSNSIFLYGLKFMLKKMINLLYILIY